MVSVVNGESDVKSFGNPSLPHGLQGEAWGISCWAYCNILQWSFPKFLPMETPGQTTLKAAENVAKLEAGDKTYETNMCEHREYLNKLIQKSSILQ